MSGYTPKESIVTDKLASPLLKKQKRRSLSDTKQFGIDSNNPDSYFATAGLKDSNIDSSVPMSRRGSLNQKDLIAMLINRRLEVSSREVKS